MVEKSLKWYSDVEVEYFFLKDANLQACQDAGHVWIEERSSNEVEKRHHDMALVRYVIPPNPTLNSLRPGQA
jgi:hypothetical protein